MPSTYTTNLGIEKIGTGEQSGTWGTTTNTNFDLIDQGVNGIVQVTLAAVGSTGSPNALTVDNGAVSDGRNKFIEFVDGGDLGGTAYVQLQPNDAEKVAFIRNSLSGSRSIIIFQGTYNASNDFEIPNGADVVLKFDGAGASATVTQVFENLTVSSATLASGVTVNAILDEDNMASDSDTALATQQSIKAYVDSQVTAQDLDIAGDTGTGAVDLDSQSLTIAGTANEIETSASGQTITVGLPNAVTIADLTATTADINGGTIDGTVIGGSSAAAITGTTITGTSFVSSGDMTFGDNDKAVFGAGSDLQIYHSGTQSYVQEVGTGNLILSGNGTNVQLFDGANNQSMVRAITGAEVELYHNGSEKLATTSTGIDVTGTVTADGLTVDGIMEVSGTSTGLRIMETDTTDLNSYIRNSSGLFLVSTLNDAKSAVINRFQITHNTGDISFYEDTGTTPKFFWDASAESLGIGGQPTAGYALDVVSSGNTILGLTSADGSYAELRFGDATDKSRGSIQYTSTDEMIFTRGNMAEAMRIDSSGNVGIGTSSPDRQLVINNASSFAGLKLTEGVASTDVRLTASDSGAGLFGTWSNHPLVLYTNGLERARIASSGNVGIGTTSPATALDVNGTVTADGLTLDFNQDLQVGGTTYPFSISKASAGSLPVTFKDTNDAANASVSFVMRAGSANERTALKMDGNNDISFYEDTGTTPKFFWDASAESLGIGTSSPSEKLEIFGNALLTTGYKIYGNANTGLTSSYLSLYNAVDGGIDLMANYTTSKITFGTAGSERARIDSSGNLLVGKTTTLLADTGVAMLSSGLTKIVTDGLVTTQFNRLTSDGDIVDFRKDGTTVGSISTDSNDIAIGTNDTGLRFLDSADAIQPYNMTTNATRDNAIDLGRSTTRFKDLYLSGGVYLGGTGAANHLDDYEEGQWTPEYAGTTTAGVGIYTFQHGSYIKVGNLVTVNGFFRSTAHTGTGDISISNLPFTVSSGSDEYGVLNIGESFNLAKSADTMLTGYASPGSTIITLRQITTAATTTVTSSVPMDTGFDILFTCTYRTV